MIAETKYKVGLCHLLIGKFDESVAALKESAEYLDGVICSIKEKDPAASTEATIKELEETKQEIQNKIIEVEETKTQVNIYQWTGWMVQMDFDSHTFSLKQRVSMLYSPSKK